MKQTALLISLLILSEICFALTRAILLDLCISSYSFSHVIFRVEMLYVRYTLHQHILMHSTSMRNGSAKKREERIFQCRFQDFKSSTNKKKNSGLSPRTNYTDRCITRN
jgi:hypothetical protein